MDANLPTAPDQHGHPVFDTIHDLHPDHHDPQLQVVEQNVWIALLPLALIAVSVLLFVAASWTILVAAQ